MKSVVLELHFEKCYFNLDVPLIYNEDRLAIPGNYITLEMTDCFKIQSKRRESFEGVSSMYQHQRK